MTDIQISRRAGRDRRGEIKTLFAALCGGGDGGGHYNTHNALSGRGQGGRRAEDGDVLISFLGHRGRRRSQGVSIRESPAYELIGVSTNHKAMRLRCI